MKFKVMLGIAILSMVSIFWCAKTFADDTAISPEEAKRLKEENAKVQAENAKLKKALERRNDEEPTNSDTNKIGVETLSTAINTPSHWWSTLGLKNWFTTLAPGDGSTRRETSLLVSINVGYDKIFVNLSANPGKVYRNSNYTGGIQNGHIAANLGYLITPEFSVAIGNKVGELIYLDNPPPYQNQVNPASPNFNTIGAAYNRRFTDSKFSISSTIAYGQGKMTADPFAAYTGTTSGTTQFFGYDIGAGYNPYDSLKLILFYRMEQFDTLFPTTLYPQPSTYAANLEMKRMKLGGPGIGVAWSF